LLSEIEFYFTFRYNVDYVDNNGPAAVRWNVLPTPVSVTAETSQTVDIIHDGWVIVSPDSSLISEANYLAGED
jgi:hypothetical protein